MRYAVRRNPEYPFSYFQEEMEGDSVWQNIIFPGIPRMDTLSITVETYVESLTIEELAYEMYEEKMPIYIHYWIEYEDISNRFYILQQTFGLHGTQDSTLQWSQDYARDIEQACRPGYGRSEP